MVQGDVVNGFLRGGHVPLFQNAVAHHAVAGGIEHGVFQVLLPDGQAGFGLVVLGQRLGYVFLTGTGQQQFQLFSGYVQIGGGHLPGGDGVVRLLAGDGFCFSQRLQPFAAHSGVVQRSFRGLNVCPRLGYFFRARAVFNAQVVLAGGFRYLPGFVRGLPEPHRFQRGELLAGNNRVPFVHQHGVNTFGDEESQIHLAQVHIAVKNGFVLGPGRSFPVDEPGGRSCRRKENQEDNQLFHNFIYTRV